LREINKSELPLYIWSGKQCIDWKNSIGKQIEFVYDDIEGKIEIINFCSNNRYITVKYNDSIHLIGAHNLLSARLGTVVGKKTSAFKLGLGDTIYDNKRNLTILDRKSRVTNGGRIEKVYKCICNTCGFSKWITESQLLTKKSGCSCNIIYYKEPWMIEYIKDKELSKALSVNSTKKILMVCPDCGKEKLMAPYALYSLRKMGCICGDGFSYPEKFMYSVLDQLNLEFQRGFRPIWLINDQASQKEFDFYLPNQKIIIEVDGGLGHGKGTHCYSKMTAIESLAIDKWKDNQAIKQGLSVYRIDADKSEVNYLKAQIIRAVGHLFDFSKIDWSKCNNFATKNITKQVCCYYESYKPITLIDMANKFGISTATIYDYLSFGNKMNWCNYTSEYSDKIRNEKFKEYNKSISKKIAIFKNGEYLDTYSSITQAEKISEEVFGAKFSRSCIRKVANGVQKDHMGYTFEFVS